MDVDAGGEEVMPPHPNMMAVWDQIACQRGHTEHQTRLVTIDLSSRHRYNDLPQIPRRLHRSFKMYIWDTDIYPVDGGPYCPAHDAVSETLISHNTWEPRETVLALCVFESRPPDTIMLDLGAQLGWFSLLAASSGMEVGAIEADSENLRVLGLSAELNGWGPLINRWHHRIGDSSPPVLTDQRVRFAKIDLEGAENHAIDLLWPLLSNGLVDHMMMEVSPVFADYYPDLVARIMDAGYHAYLLPPKHSPPYPIDPPASAMRRRELTRSGALSLIPTLHQEDFWFRHEDAAW